MDRASQEGIGRRARWLAWVAILAMLLLPSSAAAQDQNQAGLVIRFPDGRVETQCIAFEGETISGDEILKRSGLDIVIDPSSGMGITVCQIEGQGCDYPAQPCFCQCMGGESCGYWNYFYREPAVGGPGDAPWTYSPLGALLREVPPGGMEAWVWGDGRTPPAAELTFEAVCAPPTPTTEPTVLAPAATSTPRPVYTAAPPVTATSTATPAATATMVAMAAQDTPTSTPPTATAPPPTVAQAGAADGAEPGGGNYLVFGLIVLLLVAAGVVVLLRQRGERRA